MDQMTEPVASYGRGATARCRSFPPGARERPRQCTEAPRHDGLPHHNVRGEYWGEGAVPCPDCGHDVSRHREPTVDEDGDRHGGGCIAVDRVAPPPRKPAFGASARVKDRYYAASRAAHRSCACWRDPDAVRNPERYAPKLKVGQRCRSKVDPTLIGVVDHYEYHERGWLSPIPYCVYWDDGARAVAVLGMLSIYASDGGVEAIP